MTVARYNWGRRNRVTVLVSVLAMLERGDNEKA